MAYFKITYLGQAGNVEAMSRAAETREQAIAQSGLPQQIIVSVRLDPFGAIRALFVKRFPLVEQALVLTAIASKLNSGKTFSKAVVESVAYTRIGINKSEVESCQTPQEYLTLFRFDETATLLADAGEKSGKLAEALLRAAAAIKEREQARKEFGKAMTQGVIYSVLGLLFMIGIPLWAGNSIIDFIEVQRLQLNLNNFSKVILFLHKVYTQFSIPLFAVIGVIYFFRVRIWDMTKNWPLIRVINERAKVRRGLDFVQTYQLLLSSGYTNPQCFKFLCLRSKGLAHSLYKDALDRLAEGRELSEIFVGDDWPPIIHQNLHGFDMQSPSGRDNVLSNLANALKEYYLQYSGQVSRLCLAMGFGMILITIVLFAVGFYMPLVNISQNMG